MRRGLLVSDFWYTRILDPRTVVITGLTRNGVWLIEDGEITAPVSTLRFTQSYPKALAPGAILGVGSGRQPGTGPHCERAGAHAEPAPGRLAHHRRRRRLASVS
jgi:predicted Zn-dependent protease